MKSLADRGFRLESDDMRHITLILGFILISGASHARDVDSKADLERLRGFDSWLRQQLDDEKERLSDVDDVHKQRLAWERRKLEDLEIYKREHAKLKARLGEASAEYREDLKEKREDQLRLDKARRDQVQEREARRREERATITLSEESELGIDRDLPRVDWKKRKFFAVTGTGSSGGRFSGSPGGSAGSAPPPEFMGTNIPAPPPPDFYESEPPPPPPPPPMEPGGFPGAFDDPIPPPIFDEPPDF